jgi:phage shock protein PspC (stress-responsive transcriptional regulator)
MKQVININFQGRVVPIEVTAFEILKNYIESLNRHFANEEGKEEIINDIENRIGELFQERLKEGATCITEDDVNAIMKSMGRPEEFDAEPEFVSTSGTRNESNNTSESAGNATGTTARPKRLYRDENHKVLGGVASGIAHYLGIDVVIVRIIFVLLFGVLFIPYLILWIAVPSSASIEIGSTKKKLYRDPEDKIIAGVCSGIANYFGINAWIIRVLFLLPFLSFVRGWGNWDGMDFPHFISVGSSPGALIIYIILWLVMPEASTTAEKLEMKGEKVDMNSIKNSVMEEMKGVQQRAGKLGREAKAAAMEKGKTMGTEVGIVTKRGSRSLGDVIVFLFKVFAYFVLGVIIISIVIALFTFGIAAIGLFPLKDFILTSGLQETFAWGTLIFFIAVPIIGIITWIIRRLAKVKTGRRTMRLSFLSLWFIGLVCLIGLIVSLSRDFRSSNDLNEEEVALTNPGISKLEITSNSPAKRFYRNNWFRMQPFIDLNEDTAYVKNIRVQIVKSSNDSFKVTILKTVDGRSGREANILADHMDFHAYQNDSLLLIDRGIPITKREKFRNQQVLITVYVPVGKKIRVDESAGWSDDVHFNGPFRDFRDVNFNQEIEHGWETNTDYIMKADGLYTVDENIPADEWKHRNRRTRVDINKNDLNVTVDEEGNADDNYRYDNATPAPATDSLKFTEEKRIKDSVEQDKKHKNQKKTGYNKKDNGSTAMLNSLNGYNPMLLIMN